MKTTSVVAGEMGWAGRGEGKARAIAKTLRQLPSPRRRSQATLRLFLALCLLVLGAVLAGTAGAAEFTQGASARQGQPASVPAKFVEVPASGNLLRQLAAGGYALYLRHGTTNNAIPDRTPHVDLNDCSTQRPLTEDGRQLMARVGESIRKADIRIGEFRVSPMCRARQSAEAAFPALSPVVDNRLIYLANFTEADKAPIVANTRRLLSTPVPLGSNRLVLAHAPNLMDLIGYFPKEGTLVVFRPKGEAGFEYVASIAPGLWSDLLRQGKK